MRYRYSPKQPRFLLQDYRNPSVLTTYRTPLFLQFMLHSKEMPAQNDAHFIVKHIKDVRKEAEAASSFNHLCNLVMRTCGAAGALEV